VYATYEFVSCGVMPVSTRSVGVATRVIVIFEDEQGPANALTGASAATMAIRTSASRERNLFI
jgi:hypothetical protein